ncbi:MAG TPA: tRNA (adenosine(37)-N6)-dimethylallyltransferase MiaA [Acholeplasmataceae bacterium]|nr:tRNA (adenosine(37)-N6)-dimethylallyltransferase MiaA [Acholeplasmataceae bacterium]
MKKVIVIVGPTGSGKTKYSVQLAKAIGGEVINGDSVQIYRELNVGSAKIKEEEKEGIKHHLFDIKNVLEPYSAFDFQKDVRRKIEEIDIPIIVGGTGYYIKSALFNYEFDEKSNFDENQYEDLSNQEIYEKLVKLDPNIDVDINNRRRLISGLRQALRGNLRSGKTSKNEPLYDIFIVYLDIERDKLEELLEIRLDKQLEDGFIEEVKSLHNQEIKLNIIGYRELDKYLAGIYSLEEAKREIIKVSKRLAKKQKTWFKNQMEVNMYNPLEINTQKKIIEDVRNFLKESK